MTAPNLHAHESILGELRASYPAAVLDGAVNPDLYCAAPVRILWVLREVNGDGTPWDLREFLSTPETLFTYPKWHTTFGIVAKVSMGLLKRLGASDFSDLDARAAAPILARIAVVNLNKLGGGRQVDWQRYPQRIADFSQFVTRQIEALDPNIVIAAGTFDHLPRALQAETVSTSQRSTQTASRFVVVRAYHPGQRRMTHAAYYASVVDQLADAGYAAPPPMAV